MIVTEITPEGTVFVQNVQQGPKAEAVISKLHQEFQSNPPTPGTYKPKRGDICAAKYTVDGEWYRAKVEKVQGNDVSVLYIDYGNREVMISSFIFFILFTWYSLTKCRGLHRLVLLDTSPHLLLFGATPWCR